MYHQVQLQQFPTITQFYSVTRNTFWKINNKNHILLFIHEGSCKITLNGESYILHPGDVFFIPKDYSYLRQSIGGEMCSMTYIHFSIPGSCEFLEQESLHARITHVRDHLENAILNDAPVIPTQNDLFLESHYSPGLDSPIFTQLHNIRLYSTNRQIMCGLQSCVALCGILCALSQQTVARISSEALSGSQATIPSPLKKAIRYIRSHYAEKISLDTLANHSNVSKQQLIRYFKLIFHTTPNAYICEYRISHAKELLHTQPQLTVKEISDELGYSDQHYFCKVFTRTTGESPTQYRERTNSYSDREH